MSLNFTEPKQAADGSYFVKVTGQEGGRVLVQCNDAVLETPYAEGSDITVTVSVPEVFGSYDAQIMAAATEHSTSWFGREVKSKTIETAYQKSVTDGSMNVAKFPRLKAFTAKREPLDPNELGAGTRCDVVMELQSVWFMKKTFGASWKLIQMRTKPEPKKKFYEDYLFSDEPETPDEESDDEP